MVKSTPMINSFDPEARGTLPPRMRNLVARRASVLGPGYRLFYSEPIELVSGSGVHLRDAEGRTYLDAYNNVPSVGHAHPRVAEAIAAQAARLNTHTRYAAEPILDYADRLLATHAPDLGNVTFTCTGSEAIDLALRVATFGGRHGIVVSENAYHGVTAAAAAISPSLDPSAALAPHVRAVPAPGPAASTCRPAEALGDAVRDAIDDLAEHGIEVAALVLDSLLTSDGVHADPPGLLGPAVDAVHAAGGLYVADEVQSGFGRTGSMWGYARHGVVPDLAVLGKPMANGMPVAALVARPEVTAAFGAATRYFNTFGGSSVGIAAATATLDVLEEEGLVANSAAMGERLLGGLSGLRSRHAALGEVRGAGLYVGADVHDPGTGARSGPHAARVVDGLRRRGVLISATTRDGATLKIRPLLPFSRDHVDRVLETVDAELAELERRGG